MVLETYIVFASRTEFGFTSTVRGVFIVVFELDDLITIFTGFGFETASRVLDKGPGLLSTFEFEVRLEP